MKIKRRSQVETIAAPSFIIVGIFFLILSLTSGSLGGVLFSLLFISFGGIVLFTWYQCFTSKGSWAKSPVNGKYVKRTSLSIEELEKEFGPDYKEFIQKTETTKFNKGPTQSFDKTLDPDVVMPLIYGVYLILFDTLFLTAAIPSNQIILIIIGVIIIFISLFLFRMGIHNLRVARGEIGPDNSEKITDILGHFIPSTVFIIVGLVIISLGISAGNWPTIIFGSIFLLLGLIILYAFIQSTKSDGKKVTIHTGKNVSVTMNRSDLSYEEYRDITDYDGPSDETINNVVGRSINWTRTFLVLSILTVVFSIFLAISTFPTIGVIFAIVPLFFALFFFRLFLVYLKSDKEGDMRSNSNGTSSPIGNDHEDKGSKKTVSGVYRYVNCPHCGAVIEESEKICHSCKRKL